MIPLAGKSMDSSKASNDVREDKDDANDKEHDHGYDYMALQSSIPGSRYMKRPYSTASNRGKSFASSTLTLTRVRGHSLAITCVLSSCAFIVQVPVWNFQPQEKRPFANITGVIHLVWAV